MTFKCVFAMLCLSGCALAQPLPTPFRTRPGRLVCLLVVDQLRADALWKLNDSFLPALLPNGRPGGFRFLMGYGADHRRCFYDTLPTHTAVGHATLVTGAYPSVHGVVANVWCRNGSEKPSEVDEDGRQGISPRQLLSSTLGDEIKQHSLGTSRVYSLAGKSRAAVMMGGHTADLATWIDASGRWASSPYYRGWLDWIGNQPSLPEMAGSDWVWNHVSPLPPGSARSDSEPGTAALLGGAFPTRLTSVAHLQASPWANTATLELAKELVQRQQLGRENIDMLCISFSAYDKLGHEIGPFHPKLSDMLLRLDRDLSDFLGELQDQVGLENCLIALSADHGAGPVPEHAKEDGLPAERSYRETVLEPVNQALQARFGAKAHVAYFQDPHLYLSHTGLNESQLPKARELAAQILRKQAGISEVYTREQILQGRLPQTDLARLVSLSYLADRSGDVYVVQAPFWAYPYDFKTPVGDNHGSPWSADTHVPLLIYGRGIVPGIRYTNCSPRDLAATLAALLQITPPSGCSGRVLEEDLKP